MEKDAGRLETIADVGSAADFVRVAKDAGVFSCFCVSVFLFFCVSSQKRRLYALSALCVSIVRPR